MGRISYLNVLPVYHALESGIIPHNFEIVSAPPALLNDMMSRGEIQVSSCSCFEYARNPDKYYMVEDLSIGSHGPVMSVLLLSRIPVSEIGGQEILISGESHTSVALLRLLLAQRYKIEVKWRTGAVTPALHGSNPPVAFLAIGDEALRLRSHQDYPYCVDLAEAWREWTGLPFIFGLWVMSRETADANLFRENPGELLRKSRDWGLSHMDVILDMTGYGCHLTRAELKRYYEEGLVYTLSGDELRGLRLFYDMLAKSGMIARSPELRFY